MNSLPRTGNTLAAAGLASALLIGGQAVASTGNAAPPPPGTTLDLNAPHLLQQGSPGILTVRTSGSSAAKLLSISLPEGMRFSAAYPQTRISNCQILKTAVRCKVQGGKQDVRVRVVPEEVRQRYAVFNATLQSTSPQVAWRLNDQDTSGLAILPPAQTFSAVER